MPHQYYSILNIFANYLVHYWLKHFLLRVADTPTMFLSNLMWQVFVSLINEDCVTCLLFSLSVLIICSSVIIINTLEEYNTSAHTVMLKIRKKKCKDRPVALNFFLHNAGKAKSWRKWTWYDHWNDFVFAWKVQLKTIPAVVFSW